MLKDKKYFLFDIDGTLAVDDSLYEGSYDLIKYIEKINTTSIINVAIPLRANRLENTLPCLSESVEALAISRIPTAPTPIIDNRTK